MTDMSRVADLLEELISEVSGLRSELSSSTSKIQFRDLDDTHSAIQELGERSLGAPEA